MLANKLAAIALSPQVRPRLIQRGRDYIRRGFPILDGWLESHEGVFESGPAPGRSHRLRPLSPRHQLDPIGGAFDPREECVHCSW